MSLVIQVDRGDLAEEVVEAAAFRALISGEAVHLVSIVPRKREVRQNVAVDPRGDIVTCPRYSYHLQS